MSKKKKNKNKFPKRIAGVKVPKKFRRFAATPLGGALLAGGLIIGAEAIAKSPRVKRAAGGVVRETSLFGAASAHYVDEFVRSALATLFTAAEEISRGVQSRDDEPRRSVELGEAEGRRSSARYRNGGAGECRNGPFAPNVHP